MFIVRLQGPLTWRHYSQHIVIFLEIVSIAFIITKRVLGSKTFSVTASAMNLFSIHLYYDGTTVTEST